MDNVMDIARRYESVEWEEEEEEGEGENEFQSGLDVKEEEDKYLLKSVGYCRV